MDLNLRNVDGEMVKKLKTDALEAHRTLREHCLILLGGRIEKPQTGTAALMDSEAKKPRRETKPAKVETVSADDLPDEVLAAAGKPRPVVVAAKSCPDCGALGGLHQRGCGRGK